ncbi:MAG: ABC transporter permease [Acidobacteria bacterium]|nr:ABC transporter permease [Acidobacteriota bacterium]
MTKLLVRLRPFGAAHLPAGARVAAVFLLLALAVACIAPFAVRDAATSLDLSARLAPPTTGSLLGTDELGRSVASRLLLGTSVSLGVAAAAVALSFVLGSFLGLVAGERGGFLDAATGRLVDLTLAFPGLLLAVALAAVLGPSARNTVLALAVTGWVPYARLARSEARRVASLDFVAAARAFGAGSLRITFVHLLPNVLAPLVVQATLHLAGAILAESALSFLGLGVPPPAPSWGAMLAGGRAHVLDAPHVVLAPAFAILAVVLATNVLGDALVDRLDPARRTRGVAPA